MFRIDGLNEREIAEQEGSTQQAVSKSLCRAEKKIRKFLSGTKK
jgi:DNA-directed RNA polymerase specialized sigma24 family protein